MKKANNKNETIKILIKGFQDLREIVLQILSKINPSDSELEVMNQKLKEKEREIIRYTMLAEFKLTKKEIDECLDIIKLIKKTRVHRKDLIRLNATFNDFDCTATIGGVKFHCHFMLVDEFYVLQGS